MTSPVERARAYIARMDASVEGCRGSDALFAVAIALVRGFELPDAEAERLLAEWNQQHAQPPWNERELRHKLEDARRNGRTASGYLLVGDEKAAVAVPSVVDRQRKEKQAQREKWPAFHPMTVAGFSRIGALRNELIRKQREKAGLSLAGWVDPFDAGIVQGFYKLGYLSGAEVDGHRCYVIHERNFAQARRLDGGMFALVGNEAKTKNLPGSEGRWMGWHTLGAPSVNILLVEGVIGLLEGMAAITLADPKEGWTVMAATTGGAEFNTTELSRLRGRRVRVIPDNDAKGLHACGKTCAVLKGAGIMVDAYRLPEGAKDLGAVLGDAAVLREIFTLTN